MNLKFIILCLCAHFFNIIYCDEKEYIKTPFENGPLGVEVLKTHKSLQLIGSIDGLSYYFDDQVSLTMDETRTYCYGIGLRPAEFYSMNQMAYVWDRVPSIDLWTHGTQHDAVWRWNGDNEIPNGIPIGAYGDSIPGLTFDGKLEGGRRLMQTLNSQKHYPMCSS